MEDTPTLFSTSNTVDPRYRVSMHNDLVLARTDWSVAMHRVLMVLVSQIDSRSDKAFERQFVSVQDLLHASGSTSRGHNYTLVKDAVKRLVREPVEFETPDGSYTGMPLFSELRYIRHAGLISALFHERARPYLLQLERQFTSWRLDQTIQLNTGYAIRHYMLAKMVERRGRTNTHTLSVQRYRRKLCLEDKYSRFSDLERRVLAPAVEQVNDETNLSVGYHIDREGRTPVAIRFVVRSEDTSSVPRVIAPQPEVEPHERWVAGLDAEEYKQVMSEVESRAKANGFDPDTPRTWAVGCDQMLRRVWRRRHEDGDTTVD